MIQSNIRTPPSKSPDWFTMTPMILKANVNNGTQGSKYTALTIIGEGVVQSLQIMSRADNKPELFLVVDNVETKIGSAKTTVSLAGTYQTGVIGSSIYPQIVELLTPIYFATKFEVKVLNTAYDSGYGGTSIFGVVSLF